MRLHKEGSVTILIAGCILLISIAIALIFSLSILFRSIIVLPFVVLFVLILWFFRIPSRMCKPDDSAVYAPADGKIVVIEKTTEDEYFHDERMQISIFMSATNVHQNVYPVSGTVAYMKYHKGDYLVAWHPKSSVLNERSTVVIKKDNGTEILVRQIAGAMARRICTYPKTGDQVEQGAELGFIKFGSRVDIFLPTDAIIEGKLNQKVRNKMTVIARLS